MLPFTITFLIVLFTAMTSYLPAFCIYPLQYRLRPLLLVLLMSNELSSTFEILTSSRGSILEKFVFLSKNVEKEGLCSRSYFRESSSPLRYLSCDEHLISLRRSGLNKSGKVSLSIVRSVGATLRLQHLPSGKQRRW